MTASRCGGCRPREAAGARSVEHRGDPRASSGHPATLGPGLGSVQTPLPSTPGRAPPVQVVGVWPWAHSLPGNLGPRGWKAPDPGPEGSVLEVLPTLLLSVSGPGLLSSLPRGREDKIASQIAQPGGPARWEGQEARESATLALGPGPGLPRRARRRGRGTWVGRGAPS